MRITANTSYFISCYHLDAHMYLKNAYNELSLSEYVILFKYYFDNYTVHCETP